MYLRTCMHWLRTTSLTQLQCSLPQAWFHTDQIEEQNLGKLKSRFAMAPYNCSLVSMCGSEKNLREQDSREQYPSTLLIFRTLLDSNWILMRGLTFVSVYLQTGEFAPR